MGGDDDPIGVLPVEDLDPVGVEKSRRSCFTRSDNPKVLDSRPYLNDTVGLEAGQL